MYLDHHQNLIVNLNIIEKHLNEHCCEEQQTLAFQNRIARVNEKWEKVCSQSFIWQTQLGGAYFEVIFSHLCVELFITARSLFPVCFISMNMSYD